MRLFSITGLRYWRNWQIVFLLTRPDGRKNAEIIIYPYSGVQGEINGSFKVPVHMGERTV